MKRTLLFISLILAFTAVPSFAWHCPTNQHWVQVNPGTPGATIVEGIPFKCFPDNPTPSPFPAPSATSTSTSGASSNSSSTASSASSASSTQKQQQNQNQTAIGGTATASNAGNSQSIAYSSTYNQVRQAPMAYAPEAFSTALCRAGGSAGISAPIGGISIGGSKKDKDCERSMLANGFFSRGNYVAGCKLLMHVGVVKEAMTFDECVIAVQPKPIVMAPVEQPPVTIIVQAPPTVVTEKPQTINVVAPRPAVRKHVAKPCPVPVKPACQQAQPCKVSFLNGVKIIIENKGENV